MTTVASRNLFIDSEFNNSGNGFSFRLNVPPSSFSCKPNQVMKLTLTNFDVRKNWFEINQTNNVFWMQVSNTTTVNTLTTTAATNNGNTLTFAATTNAAVGQTISGLGIPIGTTITSFTSTVLTLSNNATVASGAIVYFGALSLTQYFPVVIPPGSYRAFGTTANTSYTYDSAYPYTANDLCSAIQYAITKTLAAIHVGDHIYDELGKTNLLTSGANGGNRIFTNPGTYPVNLTATTANGTTVVAPVAKVTWFSSLRKFVVTLNTGFMYAGRTIDKFIFLQYKNGLPAGHPMTSAITNWNSAYGDPTFQDSYEIVGGRPTRDVDGITLQTGIDSQSSLPFVIKPPYPAQLNSLEAIYIRLLSVSTNNYQSPGLDRGVPNNYGLVPTNIFGRIPLTATVYDDLNETISFTEPGAGIFSCYIDARQMQNFELSITDDKGRAIQEVVAGQTKLGDLSAKITIKWEVVQYDQSLNTLPPSIDIIKSLTPTGLVRPSDDILPPSTDREVLAKRKTPKPMFQPKMTLMNN